MSTEKLTDLEIRMAFLEDSLSTLDGVVQELGTSIDQMRRELSDLRDAQSSSAASQSDHLTTRDRILSEKPPHY